MAGESYFFDTDTDDLTFHPDFKNLSTVDEDFDQAGFDVAVITLPAIAPIGAQRYELYTGRDEVSQPVTLVGYGRTGQGSTGENDGPPDTAGVRRFGFNQIDAISPVTGYLQADFDNGTQVLNRMGGLGYGFAESMVVRGDSGGPGLIGNQIAGIHASVTQGGWGTFGTVLHMSRVSDFVMNRDPKFDLMNVLEQPDHVLLNMNLQDDGNDNLDDEILVRLVDSASMIEVRINGQVVWSDQVDRVLSLTIYGSEDNEDVQVLHDLYLCTDLTYGFHRQSAMRLIELVH